MKWRWDQGRLDYFQFGEIQQIAKALVAFDRCPLPRGNAPDTLRTVLGKYSARPFLPTAYKVWRNYKRVFGCQLLAVEIDGVVHVTEICRGVAAGTVTVDEYLLSLARRFSYPSPIFEGYVPSANGVFPVCAIIKYLIAEFIFKAKPLVSIDDIIDRVKGNQMTGREPLSSYRNLKHTGVRVPKSSDEYRQIRELIRFFSQFSFLKWDAPTLILDVTSTSDAQEIAALMTPELRSHHADPVREILALGGAIDPSSIPATTPGSELNAYDREFTEGSKQRVVHLRVERSTKLREFYFVNAKHPHVCNMCEMNTVKKYPWTTKLIELHHLLPLSSPVRVEEKSTSLKDLVGLCPSCHRATHRYYSHWLKQQNQKDFDSKEQAHEVYKLATEEFELR